MALPRHAPRRQLQLLKVLVALGGQAPLERITEVLWPDAEGDKALQSFHSALYRLRERLPEHAVTVGDGRVTLERAYVRVDALEFPAAVEGARRAFESENPVQAIEHSERALRWYAAPFLEGEFEPAPIPAARARLHGLFLRHVERMGQVLGGSGKPEQALAVYRVALAIDPGAEEIAQALMRCCAALGRHSEGLVAYETLRQTLREQYGVEPGEATQALRRELLEAARAKSAEPSATETAIRQAAAQPAASAARPAAFPERRPVTVVASRLAGLEGLDVEQVEAILGALREHVQVVIRDHGGILNRFESEGFVALFGVAPAHEDDPVRSVRAALTLHAWTQERARLRLQSGIATGLALVSRGELDEGPFHLTGLVPGQAAQLQGRAESGQILLSTDMRRQVADFFALDARSDPGKAGTPGAWLVLGETPVRTRFQAAERRGFTPYVGRKRERAQLAKLLAQAVAGRGQLVTVSGEAGMGKSRLVYELRRSVDRERVMVLEGRCQSYGAETPYLPFLDALRRGLGHEDGDTPESLHRKTVENVLAADPALERYLPHYLHLLSISSTQYRLPDTLQGEALRRELEESLAAGLTLLSRRRPLLLILEDWHWVDEASDSTLRHLIDLLPRHAMLAIVLYRPEQYQPAWGQREFWSPMQLRPLEVEDTAQMFRYVLGTEELPEGLMPRVHERTGGNAFFNEEIALALLEMGLVVVEGGRARLSKPADEIKLPDSVHALIRARVDRIDPESREVLRLASVVGREFSRPLLGRMHPAPSRVPDALDVLARQDLIHPLRVVPEPVYLFKHALVRDVVYDTLLLSQRKQLHEQVGAAIEELYPDRLEEHYEALAGHYCKTENVERAVEYLEKAGDKAASAYSMQVAKKHYWEAMQLLDALKMDTDQKQRRIDLNLKWAAAAFYTADDKQLKALQTALELAESLNDSTRIVKTTNALGRIDFSKGNIGVASRKFERSMDLAQAIEDQELLALPYNIVGRTCIYTSEYQKGIDYLRKGIPMMERQGNDGETAWSKSMLANTLGWVGELKEAIQLNLDAVALSRKAGNRTSESAALFRFCYVLVLYGRFQEAIRDCSQALEISRQIGNQIVTGLGIGILGFARFMSVRDREGISMMEEGIKLVESTGSHLALSPMCAWLAEAHALAGDTRQGLVAGERSLEIVQFGECWGEPIARRALAIVSAGTIDPDWSVVHEHIKASLCLARERGERPNLAHSLHRYAEILHKKGDLPVALEPLSEAEKLFAEMEMTWWSEQAAALRGRIEGGKPFVWFAPYEDGPPKL